MSENDDFIARLCSAEVPHSQRRRHIIEAEATQFTEEEIATLRPTLRDFVVEFRDSADRMDQTAVASAIRKYVATLPLDELPSAAFLLEAGERSSPPIGVELEVAKMVVRKLTANVAEGQYRAPELADRLFEIADTYLSDRLLSREKHGAIALNAVLGLALLQSDHFAECLHEIQSLRSRWFIDHLALRAREIMAEISSQFPEPRIAGQFANLSQIAALPNIPSHEGVPNAGSTAR